MEANTHKVSKGEMVWEGRNIPVYRLNTVVVGSGAAGLNCACRLFREFEDQGVANPDSQVALVTRGIGLGASNMSGSDKQTYYKLGTSPQDPDTPGSFADTLSAGGCTHKDLAFIEGANSLRSFYRLADLGVPFPHDQEGTFVGYKTDHDPRMRGTSAGPRTSRFMVKKLFAELKRYGIPIFNRYHLLAVVTDGGRARGILCLDTKGQKQEDHGLVLFDCENVVVATGGPGELYDISVYPRGQMGSYAQLFEAGAEAVNLTESQFGLASIKPRWNLSGTYQQVIPRYFSTDVHGNDEQEFLNPFFDSMATLATDIFLKGYQWPFDHDKVMAHGSSLIDILVQNEMVNRGRRVFMDFRENPRHGDHLEPFSLDTLMPEALDYLKRSGAVQATPIERLAHMNSPSISLYRQLGVDLRNEALEVGVCAQHCNGGFAVDAWWESNIRHLFVIGELAGTHGIKRPGGSALNAGQVGALRAAQRIGHVYRESTCDDSDFGELVSPVLNRFAGYLTQWQQSKTNALNPSDEKIKVQQRMSRYAGMVRSRKGVDTALREAREQWASIGNLGLRITASSFLEAIETRELVLAQIAVLEAIRRLLELGSGSRGSHLVTESSGKLPHRYLGNEWRFIPENMALREEILAIRYNVTGDHFSCQNYTPRVFSSPERWFENTWSAYRSSKVFRSDEQV
jgi:succinate dehydrogenase/fumarate reductase flavoprotein subunit